MIPEVPGSELELDSHTLPALASPVNAPLGLAVWKRGVDCFDDVARLVVDHAEQEDHALLVYRGVAQTAEVDRWAVLWPIHLRPRAGCDRSVRTIRGDFVWWRRHFMPGLGAKLGQQRRIRLVFFEPQPVLFQSALAAAETPTHDIGGNSRMVDRTGPRSGCDRAS